MQELQDAINVREFAYATSSKCNMPYQCPFCELPADRIVDRNEAGVTVRDAYPVSPGHTLIISSRHVGSFFELSAAERGHLFCLIDRAKSVLDEQYRPIAYNIGINDGAAAGQTVPHLHIHLIPRFTGDLPDPRGGVRWIIPEKADYWSKRS
jgi:diadenosine tetraphosphate (Ap4A) HIT family hydrolase